VTQQGTILKDTTLIVFTKPKVIPEVRRNPSPSLNDIQNLTNSTLERQAKSTDELLHRLIEEWDGKNMMIVGGHKMHIFTANILIFHSRYGRYMLITNELHEFC
jgi:hypothetical protein